MLSLNRYSDSWYDPPVHKSEFDDDNSFSKSERNEKRVKKYEDSISENSVEDNKSNDSETIAEIGKPVDKPNSFSVQSPKKSVKKTEVKKIDLGAAINFGKDNSPTKHTSDIEQSFVGSAKVSDNKSNEQLLDEIFNSGSDSVPNNNSNLNNNSFNLNNNLINNNNNNVIKNSSEDFADFSSFESKSNAINNTSDDFADFATAMTTQTIPTATTGLSDVFLQPTNPFGVNSTLPLNPMSSPNSSALLGDIMTPMAVSGRPNDLFSDFSSKPISAENNIYQNNTWSDLSRNVNISVDNLMGSKYENKSVPSMNQLAQQVNHLTLGPLGSPTTPTMRPTQGFSAGMSPTSVQQPFAQQMPFGLTFVF